MRGHLRGAAGACARPAAVVLLAVLALAACQQSTASTAFCPTINVFSVQGDVTRTSDIISCEDYDFNDFAPVINYCLQQLPSCYGLNTFYKDGRWQVCYLRDGTPEYTTDPSYYSCLYNFLGRRG